MSTQMVPAPTQPLAQPEKRYYWSREKGFVTCVPKISFEEFDQAGLELYRDTQDLWRVVISWFQYGQQHFTDEQLDNLQIISDQHFSLKYLKQLEHTARNVPPENLRIARRVSDIREVARIKDPVKQRRVLEEAKAKDLTKDEVKAAVNREVAPKSDAKIAVPLPFSVTLKYPASNPGQEKREWYLLALDILIGQLKDALDAHINGDKITEAKKVARANGKRHQFSGPIPKPKDQKQPGKK